MSTTSDAMKKKLAADKLEAERLAAERLAVAKLAASIAPVAMAPIPEEDSKKESEATFAPLLTTPRKEKDWKVIVDAYKNLYHKEPDTNGALVFPSREDAITFFEAQAKAKLQFLATEYVNDKRLDFHVYSCGNGQLYKGTYAEINSQLEAACKAHPDNKVTAEGREEFKQYMPAPNPASALRGHMDEHRKAGKDEEANATTTAPTPHPKAKG